MSWAGKTMIRRTGYTTACVARVSRSGSTRWWCRGVLPIKWHGASTSRHALSSSSLTGTSRKSMVAMRTTTVSLSLGMRPERNRLQRWSQCLWSRGAKIHLHRTAKWVLDLFHYSLLICFLCFSFSSFQFVLFCFVLFSIVFLQLRFTSEECVVKHHDTMTSGTLI